MTRASLTQPGAKPGVAQPYLRAGEYKMKKKKKKKKEKKKKKKKEKKDKGKEGDDSE